MKIAANGRGAVAERGPRLSLIRTPDQRLRVLVSSSLQELAAERGVVRGAIEGLRLAPVMFESGARPHPPQAVYRAYLEQSDMFVGIYWQRYGWVGPGMDGSCGTRGSLVGYAHRNGEAGRRAHC